MSAIDLQRVHDGVWAAIATADGGAVGNAAVVDLGGEALVFDTTMSLAAAAELRAAAEREAGPVRWVVLSHWHGDHVIGAGAFDGVLVSTPETRELIDTRTRERVAAAVELRLPEETFTGERSFSGEKRTVRALTFGGGHTRSDTFLWLGEEKILLAADLVVSRTHPWVGHGDVDAWPGILKRISELGPQTIVPGHGPVAGAEAIDFMLRYLDAVKKAKPGDANPFPELDYADGWERNVDALAVAA